MNVSQKRMNPKDEEAIVAALRAGASPHMVARNWKLTMAEAVALSESVANEVKEGGAAHRVLIRGLLRDQASQAVRTVREIMDGTRIDGDGNRVNILATKEGREIANVRLKAAESIMRMASRFVDEDVVRGYMEQPTNIDMQETLFDFESQVRDDGSTILVAKPNLKLVAGGEG